MVVSGIRSITDPVEIVFGRAATVLVGPNLSGKTNVARAVLLALDPSRQLDPARDLPRIAAGVEGRVDGGHVPSITCTFGERDRGRHRTRELQVSWQDGVRVVLPHDDVVTGAVVVAQAGRGCVEALVPVVEMLDVGADELAKDVLPTLRRVIPEVHRVTISFDPASVEVHDRAGFVIEDRVMAATFGAALAGHLVRRGRDVTVVVIEEPESFLHPAAQEALRDELVEVAVAADAPVLITTASPFVVPRTAESRVIALARDVRGATRVVGEATGNEAQARLLGGLFRDTGLALVLDRSGTIPPGVDGVLVVEGGTDKAYLEIAADVLGRRDELDRLAIHTGGGALPAALHAIVMRAETDVPLFVLLDNDDPGQTAKLTLTGRFEFTNRREVTTYAEVLDDHPQGAEAEDIFDWRFVDRFVEEQGEGAIRGKRILSGDHWHFDLVTSAKSAFVGWAREHATTTDVARHAALLDLLLERIPRQR